SLLLRLRPPPRAPLALRPSLSRLLPLRPPRRRPLAPPAPAPTLRRPPRRRAPPAPPFLPSTT
ncbi:hypothetical protein HDU96_000234, partial [Phlyctochytrium bullatum]